MVEEIYPQPSKLATFLKITLQLAPKIINQYLSFISEKDPLFCKLPRDLTNEIEKEEKLVIEHYSLNYSKLFFSLSLPVTDADFTLLAFKFLLGDGNLYATNSAMKGMYYFNRLNTSD